MDIHFAAHAPTSWEATGLVLFAADGGKTILHGPGLPGALLEQIDKAGSNARFTGAKGQVLDLLAPSSHDAARVTLVGLGADASVAALERGGASAWKALASSGLTHLVVLLGEASADLAAQAAFGAVLAAYRFDAYRTTEKPEQKPSVASVTLVVADPQASQEAFASLQSLADAIYFARDLVSEPANILHPESFAERVQGLERLGLGVEILGEVEMTKLGMGALLGVGIGSAKESKLAIMTWMGASDPKAQPIAFVGKGVTFDTGGISLKPADGMEEMKGDMGGAAAVTGLMYALAARKAKVNAIGILGLVENMPDGLAQRPGDVVTSMSGQTIEVINTDAEGRLVLADALWYCQDRFKPGLMVDLATLTGAIVIALGEDYAGLFSNDDTLAARLTSAGEAEGEGLWRLPLPSAYEKQIESAFADVKNTGGRPAGSITAALFLQKFVNGVPWAHLDIASTAWRKGGSNPTLPAWATGFGVRLLNRFVADHYEV